MLSNPANWSAEYRQAIDQLASTARRYCDLIERHEELTKEQLLNGLDELLPILYYRFQAMLALEPESEPDDEEEDEEARAAWEEAHHMTMEEREAKEIERFPVLASVLPVDPRGAIYRALDAKLGEHARYLEVFDPYAKDEPDREVLPHSLADDLESIYHPLKEWLPVYELGTHEALDTAVWEWSFGFRIHEGEHPDRCVARRLLPRNPRGPSEEFNLDVHVCP